MAAKSGHGTASKPQKSPEQRDVVDDGEHDPLVLPMRKTSPTAYIAGGLGIVVVVGLVLFFSGGEENAPAAPVTPAPGAEVTKEEAKAREAHLRTTAEAFEAAAKEAPRAPPPAAPAAPAEAPPTEEPKPAESTSKKVASQAPSSSKSKAPPPKPADSGKSKKSAADLDALGADITSQLK
jgi:hypothetical protein